MPAELCTTPTLAPTLGVIATSMAPLKEPLVPGLSCGVRRVDAGDGRRLQVMNRAEQTFGVSPSPLHARAVPQPQCHVCPRTYAPFLPLRQTMARTQAQSLSLEETSSSFYHLLNKHEDQATVMFPSLLQEFKKPWTPQFYGNLPFSGGYRSQN